MNGRSGPKAAPEITAAKQDLSAAYRTPAAEIEHRAAAIRRNAEGALLDDLPVDAVLLTNVALAGWISSWTAALR